jgi:iron complex transport system substrate-binding protein
MATLTRQGIDGQIYQQGQAFVTALTLTHQATYMGRHPMIYRKIGIGLFILALLAAGFTAATASENLPRRVIDLLGRHVKVPSDPRRVVALAPSVTEIVFDLGQAQRLVGATRFSNYPPAAATLPKVGSYILLDIEKIVALRPDLCIAVKDGNPKEVIDRLQSLKIPVYAVDSRDLDTVMTTVKAIGGLLAAQAKAADIVADMRARIHVVTQRAARATHRPRVFFQIGAAPIVSVGTSTFTHQLIQLAGGQNVAAGQTPYPRYSQEQVLALSPEVIIVTTMAREASGVAVKAQWERWSDLPAVRKHAVFVESSDIFDRPTPRLVDALEILARDIHPDLFREAP